MQAILDQEKYFFELTKILMNDKDTSKLNFAQMADTTRKAFEFAKKALSDIGEEKLLFMYM
jgi:hypothetical protein